MEESLNNKVSIVKGTVSQTGYEQAICTFIKADINRKDSFSDKPMYILEDRTISDNMYAVTPSVTEALNRSPRKSVGIMNDEGELIIPIINSDVIKIGDKYVAVKTSSSMEELENAKSEPTKVQENAELSQQIKNKIIETDSNVRFVCDDYYGTYDLYEIKDNYLNRICDNVSYIAINGETVYAQTNNVNDETVVINKKIEEPVTTMPIELHTNVTDTELDNLEVPVNMEEVKDGAPELVSEEVKDTFNIGEIEEDLSKSDIEPETNNYELPIEESHDFEPEIEKGQLPAYKDNKEIGEKTVFQTEDKKEENKEYSQIENEKSSENIYKLVRSVKIKLEQSQDDTKKIEELKRENSEYKDENNELKNENLEVKQENLELKNENLELKNENVDLKHENEELKQESDEKNKENIELRDENSQLRDENIELRRAQKEAEKKLEMVYKELVGFINEDNSNYQERHSSLYRNAA